VTIIPAMATGAARAIHTVSDRVCKFLIIEVISLLAVICKKDRN